MRRLCAILPFVVGCAPAAASSDAAPPADATLASDAPRCERADARGVGDCSTILGYAWNGGCEPIAGCACEGADCALFATPVACHDAHRACSVGTCGGLVGAACPPGAYCEILVPHPDASGLCFPRPASCELASPVIACGPDPRPSVCDAHARGIDPPILGECEAERAHFGSAAACGTGTTFTLTNLDERCTGPFGASTRVALAVSDVGTTVGQVFHVGPSGADGSAEHCTGFTCAALVGSVTISAADGTGATALHLDLAFEAGGPSIVGAVEITARCSTCP